MRKYGRWLLALGFMAACPALASADGFLGGRMKPTLPFAGSSQKERNQDMADQVAGALREARLSGEDIEIEVEDGQAIISGRVFGVSDRALATQVAGSVPGIRNVQNRLQYVQRAQGGIQQASATAEPQNRVAQAAAFEFEDSAPAPIQQVSGTMPGAGNQQIAEQIAASMAQSGLVGYDIEARYNNGTATLNGSVATHQQRQAAEQAVYRVAGVRTVTNNLSVNPIMQTAYNQPMPMQMMGQPMMPAGYMQPGMEQGFAPTGIGASPASFSNPHLPSHAWPAYAQYPNSAAVTYPTQYSASAWPYIGPFYPYPQVPMGWREASLEWDDGSWQLNFRDKKKEWYWLFDLHNW